MSVQVKYHREGNDWWAESPDVPEFVAGASSFGELRRLTSEGLDFYLGESHVEIDEYIEDVPLADGRGSWLQRAFLGATDSIFADNVVSVRPFAALPVTPMWDFKPAMAQIHP